MGDFEILVYRRSRDKFESYGRFDRMLDFLDGVVRKRMWSKAHYDCIGIGDNDVLLFVLSWDHDLTAHTITDRVIYPRSTLLEVLQE